MRTVRLLIGKLIALVPPTISAFSEIVADTFAFALVAIGVNFSLISDSGIALQRICPQKRKKI